MKKAHPKRPILIGGKLSTTADTFLVTSPYTQTTIAEVCTAGPDDLERAIHAAETASVKMGELPRSRIAEGLDKIASGIEERAEEFTNLIAEESGKPLIYARGEVQRAVSTFSFAAAEALRFAGEEIPLDTQPAGRGRTGWALRVPRGVIYGITPFNFPLNLVAHKVAPALASGNAIIVKPSPRTPLTALLLGEVFLASGLPDSALQVVPMDTAFIGSVLTDERVKMISFTGSDKVGWELKNRAGKKAVALELGGNAPLIVDEGVDIGTASQRTVVGAFAFSGQVCISVQRILLHENISSDFASDLARRANALRTGDPLSERTQLSVMIDEEAAKRAESWVNEAIEGGAELVCGNRREGAMLYPTILRGVSPEMRVVDEEIFAPVAVLETFSDFREAVELANRSKYGLQAGVFTDNLRNAMHAAHNLEYGGVIINDVPTFRVDNMPYGGVKDSGFGREGVRYSMEEMSETRLVTFSDA